MKKLLLSLVLIVPFFLHAQNCSNGISGTFTVGPSGNYPSIKAAIDTLMVKGVSGSVILELQQDYTTASESFPIRLPLIPCISYQKTITIRPAASATNITISSNADSATIDLKNAMYYIIDGRSGGTGTAKNLTISNTNLNGSAVRIVNDASYNTLRFINLKGVNNSSFGGVVYIGGTDFFQGNCNYNRIDSCLIHDGTTTPANGIYMRGALGKVNTGNSVTGCELFNFFLYNGDSHGILLGYNNYKNSITGNSFYQTSARMYSGFPSFVYGIRIGTDFEGGHVISKNFIGGNAAAGGSQKMYLSGNFAFTGIYVSCNKGDTNASRIDSNVISNLYLYTASSTRIHRMINLGNSDGTSSSGFTGTCNSNIIGSDVSDTSITVRTDIGFNNGSIGFYGIDGYVRCSTADSLVIQNNFINGIYGDSLSKGTTDIYGMRLASGTTGLCRLTIQNNIVGSVTHPKSINNRTGGFITGIFLYYNPQQQSLTTVTKNTIANLRSETSMGMFNGVWAYNNTVGQILGIAVTGDISGTVNVTDNQLHDFHLKVTTPRPPALAGIYVLNVGSGNYSGNLIHDLSADEATSIDGIVLENNNNLQGVDRITSINKNFIHSLQARTSSNSYPYNVGIDISNPNNITNVENNMIRLGLDSAGNSMSYKQIIVGIFDRNGKNNFLHNSVFIGGTSTDVESTSAYYGVSPTILRSIRNNILVNRRSSQMLPTLSQHWCIAFSNTLIYFPPGYDTTGQSPKFPNSINNNLYQFNANSGGLLGFYNGSYNTLQAWKQATSIDSNSLVADPVFINPTGNAANLNLHLGYASPAESAGSTTGTTLTDFDGDVRASLTPVDIGADAGNFSCTAFLQPTISISSSACGSSAVTFNAVTTNGGTNPTIQWYVNNTFAGSGATYTLNNAVYGAQVSAKLISTASCANPQTANSNTIVLNCVITAIANIDGVELLEIAPNPNDGLVKIKLKLSRIKKVAFEVFDNTGKKIYATGERNMSGAVITEINLRNRPKGVYYLKITIGNNAMVKKIIIQ